MKKIELHKANNFSHGNVLYRRGVVYKVSDGLFEELSALKNPRGVPYFRAPLTAAQKKHIAERAALARATAGASESRVNNGANIVTVEDAIKGGAKEAAPEAGEEEKPEVVDHDDGDDTDTDGGVSV